jgi:hypothetical protein
LDEVIAKQLSDSDESHSPIFQTLGVILAQPIDCGLSGFSKPYLSYSWTRCLEVALQNLLPLVRTVSAEELLSAHLSPWCSMLQPELQTLGS